MTVFLGNNCEVSRARSVEELNPELSSGAVSNEPPSDGPSSLPGRPQVSTKGSGAKVDWKNFQEAVSYSGMKANYDFRSDS